MINSKSVKKAIELYSMWQESKKDSSLGQMSILDTLSLLRSLSLHREYLESIFTILEESKDETLDSVKELCTNLKNLVPESAFVGPPGSGNPLGDPIYELKGSRTGKVKSIVLDANP